MKRLMIVAVLLAVATIATAYTNEELLQMKRTNPDRYDRYIQVTKGQEAGTPLERAKAAARPGAFAQAGPGQGQIDAAGGPDGYGYIYKDETETGGPTYNWIDTVGATSAAITGDDSYGTITLPFTFSFYGQNITTVYPSTNGQMGLSTATSTYSNTTLPTTNLPANHLCPYWDDLYVDGGSMNIMYKTVGSSPNRQFVVIWDSVRTLSGSYYLVFEVILSEADGGITYQYRYLDANALGQSATVGEQQGQTGANYLQYSYLSASLVAGRAIKFWKPMYANDVGMFRINVPNGIYQTGTINPSVVIKNYGTSAQSGFGVKLDIGSSYTSTVTVGATVAPGDTYVVSTFTAWNASTPGQYAVRCSTRLSSDQEPGNDRKTANALIASLVEHFDATNGNYAVSGGGWVWRAPAYPRPAPPSPPKAWSDPDSGAYVASADHKLISCLYIATQNNPQIIFFHRCSTESYYDGGNVAYSTDGGSNWTLLEPDTTGGRRPYYGTLYSGERGWCGVNPWEMAVFSVPVSNGVAFKMRWRFTSDGSVQYDGGGWMIDEFAGVGITKPANDVGVGRIIVPTGTIPWGTPVTPSAKVFNYGSVTQTFKVRFVIGSVYTDSATVNSLAAGDSVTVSFPQWAADVAGTHDTRCSTRLATDQVTSNDKVTGSVLVQLVDAGSVCIWSPVGGGMVDSGAVVSPRCSVMNYGSATVSFDVDIHIGSGYNATGSATSVPPNSKRAVVFPSGSWTATQRGWVPMRCSTKLASDQRTNNDRKLDSVLVRVRDIGAVRITSPVGAILPGAMIPAADVHNWGNTREASKVYFRINSSPAYLDSVVLANGLPFADTNLTFKSWTATSGTYTARCSTGLTGDVKRTNDTCSTRFAVGTIDAAVTLIVAPAGSADTTTLQTPKAKLKNLGTAAATGVKAYFSIDSTVGNRVYYDSLTTDIAGGAEITVTFRAWPKPYRFGTYLTKCKVVAIGDGNPANDSLTGMFVVASAPPGWYTKKAMPAGAKAIKDGGFLASDAGMGKIYASRGNKQPDFLAYYPLGDSWKALAPWLPGTEGKLPSKGSAGCATGSGAVYATKGNNTVGFFKYHDSTKTWTQKAPVPLGLSNKKVKGGTNLAWAYKGGVGNPYLLKGYKNEFYKYNVDGDSWTTLAPGPGATVKWDKGSWLASDGAHTIYAHKAKYHEFYKYDTEKDSWNPTALVAMPIPGSAGSKKSKDGGCGTYLNSSIFALKGGNTQEFWQYAVATNAWAEKETLPKGTLKKKVKAGGSIAVGGTNLYAIKGNKTDELWMYVPGAFLLLPEPEREGVLAGKTVIAQGVSISPNPLAGGFVHLAVGGTSLSRPALVRLYDAAGRCVGVWKPLLRNGSTDLDVRHLAAGVYLVRVEAEGFVTSQKLVVQR